MAIFICDIIADKVHYRNQWSQSRNQKSSKKSQLFEISYAIFNGVASLDSSSLVASYVATS